MVPLRLGLTLTVTLATMAARLPAEELITPALSLKITNGVVTGLTNRIVGETYTAGRIVRDPLVGMLRAEGTSLRPTTGRAERRSDGTLLFRSQSGADRLTSRYARRADGSVEVRQYAAGAQGSVQGVLWGIGDIPDRCEALVPGNSGQRFGRDAPFETRIFEYPTDWEAPFLVIQGAKGGVLIQAEDPALTPKVLTVERRPGAFRITFESRNQAPFKPRKSITGVRWVIRAYRGSWAVGAGLYRRWAEHAYVVQPLSKKRPEWAAGIRFVATVRMDLDVLRVLAQRVIPSRTLLYVPDWRRDEYDRNYPDYTASPAFGPFVAEAHRFGFRVMPHVNYFGCDPKNPEYARLQQYQMRDPFHHQPLWWDWPRAEPPIKFAYINPASREWRTLFIARMKELCRRYSIDALHLDQTLCIFNDDNGLVDGMTCAEGSLALHRELKAALPDVALSGEGLNEITSRYEEFAQRHVWGMYHADGTWDERKLAMAHPIASAVLLPGTSIYGYLGMPNPCTSPDVFDAWMRAYDRLGVLPTYPWPTAAELRPPSPEPAQKALRRAALFLRQAPTPDFAPSDWHPQDHFVWSAPGGVRIRITGNPSSRLQLEAPGGKPLVMERRIQGVAAWEEGGSIIGWPVYDGKRAAGLDPSSRYEWSPMPANPKTPHLTGLPAGYCVTRAGIHDDLLRLQIDRIGDRGRISLWDRADGVAVGVLGWRQRNTRIEAPALGDGSIGAVVEMDGDGVFMHPPWKGRETNGSEPGAVFVEYRLDLPDRDGLTFRADAHLRDGASRSDGVRFTAIAWPLGDPADRATTQVIAAPAHQSQLSLSLDRWRGQRIVLRLQADAGPAGDPSFDWGRLRRPEVVWDPRSRSRTPVRLTVKGDRSFRTALAGQGSAHLEAKPPDAAEVDVELPNTLLIPLNEPSAVASAGCSLLELPWRSRIRAASGLEGGALPIPSTLTQASVGGVERTALLEHPPMNGAALIDYHLALPDTPMELAAALGVRDGSRSTGVGFRVEVNGMAMFQRDTTPGTPWEDVRIDLSSFAGREIVLTLVVDALGGYDYDWAVWAEPRLVPRSTGR